MEQLPIGKIIRTANQERDAIHVAVAPVCAEASLKPGQHIGVSAEGMANTTRRHIGIVDPFLRQTVKRGERFWIFL